MKGWITGRTQNLRERRSWRWSRMIDTRSRVASGDEGKPRGLFDETWLCGASLGGWDSRVASRRGAAA